MKEEKFEVIKFIDNEVEVDVSFSPKEETVWMSQEQIANLFSRDKSVISRHIKNALFEELSDQVVIAKIATTTKHGAIEGKVQTHYVDYYNLDVVLSVGYRVKSKRGVQFRKWVNNVLKEYMLKGYVINENRVVVTNENYLSLVESVNNINNEIDSMDNRIVKLEDKINSKELPLEKIFYDGEVYDAYELIKNIFKKAKQSIIIIDNYIDNTILERLKVKKENIEVTIYTNNINNKITNLELNTFIKQYGNINIIHKINIHDRFIIIDKNILYHLGASIKDAGKRVFGIHKMDNELINTLLEKLKQ